MASRRRVDDSEDDSTEATALDIRPLSRPARPVADVPAAPRRPLPRATLHDSSDEHEDATEFLSARPPSVAPRSMSSSPLEARGNRRAVPLDQDDMPSSSRAPHQSVRPLPQRSLDSMTGHSTTASVPQVMRLRVDDDESSTGEHGPHEHIAAAGDDDSERTLPPDRLQAMPRPAMQPVGPSPVAPSAPPQPSPRPPRPSTMVDVVDDETQAPDEPADVTEAPTDAPAQKLRPVPLSAEAPRPRSSRALDDPADGVLVVEAPPDASITVNGVDRGRGVVRVLELDRHARHAVRIHCPGHLPWSGSVSLEGRPAAKIKPTLKPRAR